MTDNPWRGPDEAGRRRRPLPPPSPLMEWGVALGVIAVLVMLLIPAIQVERTPSRRSYCKNNLKQIVLALHNYHDTYGSFPPAFTVDESGRRLHSWRTLILPYIDQAGLYEMIDLAKPWDDPANDAAREIVLEAYRCPSAGDLQGRTTYLGVVGEGLFFPPEGTRTFADIPEQAGTAAVIDVDAAHAVHWMDPRDADEQMFQSLRKSSALQHSDVINVAIADGRILSLPADTPAEKRRSLLTIAADGRLDE